LICDQRLSVGDEVFDLHAFVKGIPAGNGDIPAQGDGVLKALGERQNVDEVAVLDRMAQPFSVERELVDGADELAGDALDQYALPRGGGGQSAREIDQVVEGVLFFHLIDRRIVDAAGDGREA
jgi:hypothetical protein